MADFDFTQVGAVPMPRVEEFEKIMTAYGRDLIMGLLVIIAGMFIIRVVMKPVRKGLARIIKNPIAAANTANVLHVLLLSGVLISAAIELGLEVMPVFRLFMVILLTVVGLMIFFRPYIPTLPFKVGQTVKAAGLLGKVEATTFLNTRIRTFDGKVFFVPNRTILNDIVINYHYTPTRRMKIDIPIRYDQDLMKAKQVLEALMIEDPRVKKTPRPAVWVLDMSNGCIRLGGRCWADNLKYWATRVDLLEKAKLRFDNEGIVISYPHMGVHHFDASAEDRALEERAAAVCKFRSSTPEEDEM